MPADVLLPVPGHPRPDERLPDHRPARRGDAPASLIPTTRRTLVTAGLALVALLAAAPAAPAAGRSAGERPAGAGPFPRGFLWGTAISGFQTEAGRDRDVDRGTDWYAWTHDAFNLRTHVVSRDRVEDGPGFLARHRADVDLARDGLGANAFRLGIEWSRIFPRSTAAVRPRRANLTVTDLRALDRLADQRAVRRYRDVLRHIRARGMTPYVTLQHFSLPRWIHDPVAVRAAFAGRGPEDPPPAVRRAGWLDPATVAEFRKYVAYAAWKYGDLVDLWSPVNEPLVMTTFGYVNIPGVLAGHFPPGVFSFTAAVRSLENLVAANAAAYDAVKAHDRRARVGLVHNMVAFTPADPGNPRDRTGAGHADRLFNRLFLDAAIRGIVDRNANGRVDPGERQPRRAGKADFIGVNYYFRNRVTGLAAPITPTIPLLDFAPRSDYRTPQRPDAPPCPTTCSEFGAELYPEGLFGVLRAAGRYGRPVYISETGLADGDDDQRPAFLVSHLAQVRRAIAAGVRVRGVFHWSLTDNFEWSAGYHPKFGLYAYDPRTLARRARPSARLFARIARANALPASLVRRYGSAFG